MAVSSATQAGFVWVETNDTENDTLYFREFDPATGDFGPTIDIFTNVSGSGPLKEASIEVLPNGNYVIAAISEAVGDDEIWFSTVTPEGDTISFIKIPATDGNGTDDFGPDVTPLAGGGFVVAWSAGSLFGEITFQIFNSSGSARGDVITTDFRGAVVGTTMNDGGFMLFHYSFAASLLIGQRYDVAGTAVGDPVEVLASQDVDWSSLSAETLGDGRVMVSWADTQTGRIDSTLLDTRDDETNGGYTPEDFTIGTIGFDFISVTANDAFGWDGNDFISVLLGGRNVDAGRGNDRVNLSVLSSTGVIDGGEGFNDSLQINFDAPGALVDLVNGVVTRTEAEGTVTQAILGFEDVDGSFGADTILGDSGRNFLTGFEGNDSILGVAGDDFIAGDAGADYLQGGNGRDTVNGGLGNDFLAGNAGDDFLDGGASQDTLLGGDGGDTLQGGFGNDLLIGGEGFDRANYVEFGGGITVNLNVTGGQNTGAAGNDTLISIEGLTGGDFNDRFTGNTGDNVLSGRLGADRLFGLGGDDDIFGGDGNDILVGGNGNDLLSANAGRDVIFGGAGNDQLAGSEGNDQLRGGAGGDFINGGEGRDILIGGEFVAGGFPGDGAADTFYFGFVTDSQPGGASRSVIRDFEQGLDDILLSDIANREGFDFTFIGSDAFSGTIGELRSFNVGGNTIIRVDTTGNAVADFEVLLNGAMILQQSDFIL